MGLLIMQGSLIEFSTTKKGKSTHGGLCPHCEPPNRRPTAKKNKARVSPTTAIGREQDRVCRILNLTHNTESRSTQGFAVSGLVTRVPSGCNTTGDGLTAAEEQRPASPPPSSGQPLPPSLISPDWQLPRKKEKRMGPASLG